MRDVAGVWSFAIAEAASSANVATSVNAILFIFSFSGQSNSRQQRFELLHSGESNMKPFYARIHAVPDKNMGLKGVADKTERLRTFGVQLRNGVHQLRLSSVG